MSIDTFSKKLDKSNNNKKKIQLSYNIIGTNKYQQLCIKDIKEDSKEETLIKYPNDQDGISKFTK